MVFFSNFKGLCNDGESNSLKDLRLEDRIGKGALRYFVINALKKSCLDLRCPFVR